MSSSHGTNYSPFSTNSLHVSVLQLKQKDVQQLLSQVDELANENRSQAEVYQAMSDSLNEAWKDLNTQLEYRKMLLDQSIAFHQSAQQVR
jgi:hypothetical protein